MAASDALHPQQLKMFMSAREIQSSYDPHEGDRKYKIMHGEMESNQEMWDRKLVESQAPIMHGKQRSPSLYEKLQTEGVQHPIPLSTMHYKGSHRPMVAGGQHRVAAMSHLNPDQLMPVLHHETIITAQSDPNYKYT